MPFLLFRIFKILHSKADKYLNHLYPLYISFVFVDYVAVETIIMDRITRLLSPDTNTSFRVKSKLLSLSIIDESIKNLSDPIQITFKHKNVGLCNFLIYNNTYQALLLLQFHKRQAVQK